VAAAREAGVGRLDGARDRRAVAGLDELAMNELHRYWITRDRAADVRF
jgi:hypothetical protein